MAKLRATTALSLRKSSDKKQDSYEEWHEWKAGETFVPPAHMDVKRALERGIVEEVKE